MNRVVLLGLFFLMPGYFIVAQSIQKSVEAIRIKDDKAPVIDGVLNDHCWDTGIFADNFIEYEPNNGGNPSFDTKVWFTYDDNALYVGAEMLDSSPDSIHTDLSQRDEVGNSDWFMLALSPSNDGQNGFKFIVTAAGVQSDIQIIKDNDYSSWDAVWHSDVSFTDSSWTLEIKIPWSAIRFPARELHRWDVNMMREIRRYRQQSSWHFIDKSKDGRLSQTGKLTGIYAITPPLRLSILPYASGYLNYYPQEKKPNYVMNYGADLRLGI
ncbi:MAG: sugar-binding protein, partial [Bacteroidales bacterium]|nr:sugar-binding protein [Bacteroidales bacterium]